MNKVPTILLVVSLFMVGIALAAPIIDMYDLYEADCRVCHDKAGVLRNTNHLDQHNLSSDDSCAGEDCHVTETGSKALDCMLGCHNETGLFPVTDHHDFEAMEIDDDCFRCHEKGVPRGLD